ncbi:uncharacterized protein [Triticum aestivum]|uniref:uncharacterized protein isoform X2 n=1 Tax=Triticum aestivum TaxID=4565 RepID=UPI001D01C7D9|nr:uncharacterized protein LOC123092473 isoform X2 [Triticum aestivum]
MGSSPGNSLLQKCRERLRTIDPKWSDPSLDPAQAGATCTRQWRHGWNERKDGNQLLAFAQRRQRRRDGTAEEVGLVVELLEAAGRRREHRCRQRLNRSSDLLRIFSMSTWDDTNSNIMFSAPGSKKAEVLGDNDVGMVTSFSNIGSQLALSSCTCPAWTTTCSCSRTPPTAESTPSVAVPLTRRALLGRETRTRINKRLRRLQDLIPYMDKVTSLLLPLSSWEYLRRRGWECGDTPWQRRMVGRRSQGGLKVDMWMLSWH